MKKLHSVGRALATIENHKDFLFQLQHRIHHNSSYRLLSTALQTWEKDLKAPENQNNNKGYHGAIMGMNTKPWDILDVLQDCIARKSLVSGKIIHAHIIKTEIQKDNIRLTNHLMNMYAKCGKVKDVHQLFDKMPQRNLVSWNIIIAAYAHSGGNSAMEVFKIVWRMQREGVRQDKFTFTSVVRACAGAAALREGRQVHTLIVKVSVDSNVFVESALVDMYAKCGSTVDARKVFDKMPERNLVTWNAMITGYTYNGEGEEALKIFRGVQRVDIGQCQFTLSSALNACAGMADLRVGSQVHSVAIKAGFLSNDFVGTGLVDMYAKCGSIEDAHTVFRTMSERSVVLWNAMITGFAQHGRGKEAVKVFEQMQQAGMKPDDVTFVCVLSACSHAGLVNEGRSYFESMTHDHGIRPNIRHYACKIDLLGRGGWLQEAEDLIKKMPFEPNAAIWGSILGACRIHGNMELARQAAEQLFKVEPQNAANHVLLSNAYAAAGRWDDVEKVWKLMKDSRAKKDTGLSWMEVKNKVHVFVVGDRSHPLTDKIYSMLERLTEQMKEAGYVPKTNSALHDVEEQQKEYHLRHHSEKLALALGIIILPLEVTIRIKKNLRMCGDCHIAFKFISNIVQREIIVRDTNRFHHFKNGICSCGDYW